MIIRLFTFFKRTHCQTLKQKTLTSKKQRRRHHIRRQNMWKFAVIKVKHTLSLKVKLFTGNITRRAVSYLFLLETSYERV